MYDNEQKSQIEFLEVRNKLWDLLNKEYDSLRTEINCLLGARRRIQVILDRICDAVGINRCSVEELDNIVLGSFAKAYGLYDLVDALLDMHVQSAKVNVDEKC